MRSSRREKQNTRRRQEQEYRDKVLTLSKTNYSVAKQPSISELNEPPIREQAPIEEAKQLAPMSSHKPRLEASTGIPRIFLSGSVRSSNLPLMILAYSLGIVGLGINAWFAWNRGSALPDKVLLSSLGFIAEAIMFFLLSQAKTLWVQRQRGSFIIACFVWLVLFVFALTNSLGFASLNLSEAATARAERITPAVSDAQRRLDTLSASRAVECVKRGDRCRALEKEEQSAMEALRTAREKVSETADPQIAAAAKLIAWMTLDRFHPAADDFAMLRLLFLTLLPQLGGLVLMVAKKA